VLNQKLLGLAGIVAILALAWVVSTNRKAIKLRIVGAAFALQAAIAFLVLWTSWGRAFIAGLSEGVASLLGYATKGTEFLFGPSEANPLAHTFAIAALPVIIFFASLVAILYYLGIMQRIVRWVGGAIGWVTGISRVESLSAAANIFVGQSESPLVVRPYLAALPPSRLFTVMVVGMAGVAGTILAAYASLLGERYLPYLLAAAFMSAPGGILMAKMIMPDDPKDTEAVEDHKVEVAETFEEGEQPAKPTSSWPRPPARRPGSSSRSRSGRWCWRSSRWSHLPTVCSAGSATGSSHTAARHGLPTSAFSASSVTCSRRSCS